MTNDSEMSNDQVVAMDLFADWHDNCEFMLKQREFMLGGLAGTGKTTLIRKMVDHIGSDDENLSVITPTAKATAVLLSKGIKSSTSHSLLCNFEREMVVDSRVTPIFSDKEIERKVIICDESSMVTQEMRQKITAAADLVVWVGDYGQLPPVEKDSRGMKGIMSEEGLDAKLTVQHRHGEALQIVKFAEYLRNGGNPQAWSPGRSAGDNVRINRKGVRGVKKICEWALDSGVFPIICYTNEMIGKVNAMIRKIQGEFNGGDRSQSLYAGLILKCSFNSYRHHVWNGELFEVADFGDTRGGITNIETTEGRKFPISFSKQNQSGAVQVVDGYAITCHNAQGSEWPKIAVIEDIPADSRWRYTGATRAQKNVDYFTKGSF